MNSKKSLMVAFGGLVISLALIASASFAWFTISTAPEITGLQVTLNTDKSLLVSYSGTDWQEEISLTESFSGFGPLRPISTVDGINWYLPSESGGSYEAITGNVTTADTFELDDTLYYANVSLSGLTGEEYQAAYDRSYYVYTDIWLMAEADGGCDVRLSVPDLTANNLSDAEKEKNTYGTYVLDNYKINTESYSGDAYSQNSASGKLIDIGYNVQDAVRIGFLINPTTMRSESGVIVSDSGYSAAYGDGVASNGGDIYHAKNKFYIYEPNADDRSLKDVKPHEEQTGEEYDGIYVVNYKLNATDSESYRNGYYIVTVPFGNSGSGIGSLSGIARDRLIVQKKSTWDYDKLYASLSGNTGFNSGLISSFGKFVATSDDMIAEKYVSTSADRSFDMSSEYTVVGSQRLIHLTQGVPVKVRIFIWIEGQDVDCWNDVADSSFRINLELSGSPSY